MKKFKKSYCRFSVAFAVFVIAITIMFARAQDNVYATAANDGTAVIDENQRDGSTTDSITPEDEQRVGNFNVSQGGDVESATSDSTNGLTFIYNNEEGTLSGSIRILLVLTVIALAPSIGRAHV